MTDSEKSPGEFSRPTQVILGTVRNLNIDAVRPFVESLRGTGYTGDCVFFCARISRETRQYLRERGVIVVPFFYWAIRNNQPLLLLWPFWRLLIRMTPGFSWKTTIARRVWHLFYLRFLLYHEFLLEHPHYSQVMLTDVRDVCFQQDPFLWMDGKEGVFCFEEAEGRKIGQCPYNRMMIVEAFGRERGKWLDECQISCAGVTMGTRKSILSYLKKFCELGFESRSPKTSTGSDQGIHNWIVHAKMLPDLLLINNEGPLNTMGLLREEEIRMGTGGLVLNRQGVPYALLHQYDRFPEVVAGFKERMKRNVAG